MTFELPDEAQHYLLVASGLSLFACALTYCASNWDDPPYWWPEYPQPCCNSEEDELDRV